MKQLFLLTITFTMLLAPVEVEARRRNRQSTEGFEGVEPTRKVMIQKARIGEDNRVPADVNSFPFRAVGRVTGSWDGSGRYSCSGTMVSKNIVLTNGHCVWDKKGKRLAQDVRFAPGYYDGNHPEYGSINAREIFVPRSYKKRRIGLDYAFIILEEDIGLETGWLATTEYRSSLRGDKRFYISGYGSNWVNDPFSTQKQTVNEVPCKVGLRFLFRRLLIHDCDTGQGSSGSSIWLYENEEPKIVGVNFGGAGPRNDNRMKSCRRFFPGICSNFATNQSKFISDLKRLIEEHD